MSIHSPDTTLAGFGQRFFKLPPYPAVRIWASKEVFPDGLYVVAIDNIVNREKRDCIHFSQKIDWPLKFVLDDGPGGTGNWSTAPILDFNINHVEPEPSEPHKQPLELEGFIYIGPSKDTSKSFFTLYITSSATKLTTKFGKYAGIKEIPIPFENGGENYFSDMTDAEGNWLWLYRLYGPHNL